jgi:hypothetical protein
MIGYKTTKTIKERAEGIALTATATATTTTLWQGYG